MRHLLSDWEARERGGEEERQSSEYMETLLRENIAKIAGKKNLINKLISSGNSVCVWGERGWGGGGLH